MSEVQVIECSSSNELKPIAPISFDILDNFKISWKFLNQLGSSDEVHLADLDFKFEFFTKGNPERFIAYKLGSEYANCKLLSSESTIVCILEDHLLKPGLLHCNITVSYPDPDFYSEKASIVETKYLSIELIDSTNSQNLNAINSTLSNDINWEYNI